MVKSAFCILAFFFALLFCTPANLFAAAETHDGFYLNFQLGAGYGETTLEESGDDDFIMDGTTGVFRIKAGGAPADNFIIYGVYGAYSIEDPDYEYGSASGTMKETTLTYYDLGVGVCYYFMPINIYISADIASTKGTLEMYDETADTERGASFTLSVGKEWWVSDDWGLGVALILSGASMDDEGNSDITVSHSFFGVAFTATYN